MKYPLPELFCSFECYREYTSIVVAFPYDKGETEELCINCGEPNKKED